MYCKPLLSPPCLQSSWSIRSKSASEKPLKKTHHLLGSRVQLGGPQVAVWTNPSGTGDGIAPGSTELVVVGGMHIEREVDSGIEWLKGSLDGE